METKAFSRGSEWRKWDLHIHAPSVYTCAKNDNFIGDNFEDKQKIFIEDLKKIDDIAVIGIADYFSLDGFKFVSDNKFQLKQFDLILPNIELRITPVTDSNNKINLHIIPNTEVIPIDEIEKFLYKFEFGQDKLTCKKDDLIKLGKQLDSSLSNEKAFKKGLNEYYISYDKFFEIYNQQSEKFKKHTLISVSNNSCDGASGLKNYPVLRNIIYSGVHFLFSSASSDREYFLGKKSDTPEIVIQKYGGLKACLHGSDYHGSKNGAQVGVPNLNRFCWIKSDPTFNGLKQVLYEPESRVRIQEMNPDNKAGYLVIDAIILEEAPFWKQTIYLNSYLNTIIGGRSTGKSFLLQCIAKKIDPKIQIKDDKRKDFVEDHYEKITVKWKYGESSSPKEIMYFPQNYMIGLAENKQELDNLVDDIVKDKDKNHRLDEYKNFCIENKRIITDLVNQLFYTNREIKSKEKILKEKGNQEGIQAEIDKLNEKINSININSQISEEELMEYNSLKREILKKQEKINAVQNDVNGLEHLDELDIFTSYYTNALFSLSNEIQDELFSFINKMKDEFQIKWKGRIDIIKNRLNVSLENLSKEINHIQNNNIYKKGLTYFSKNKEYKELQEQLKTENEKLNFIKIIIDQIKSYSLKKDKLFGEIIERHFMYFSKIQQLSEELEYQYSDVTIKSESVFRKKDMIDFLKERHDLRGVEKQNYIDDFISKYDGDNIKNITRKYLEDALEENIEYKNFNESSLVVLELLSENWYKVTYNIKYENDSFDDMSQGKKSFVILKLLLDFSDKKCPILLDQPEDNLDNRAIYNELVQYLRKKKQERQLIIVTHNSNIVVSADSENVIVANQKGAKSKNKNDSKFQYVNGALENTKPKDNNEEYILESQGIREHVCEILEGGIEAFRERERKYGI